MRAFTAVAGPPRGPGDSSLLPDRVAVRLGGRYNDDMSTSTDNLAILATLSTDMEAAMIIAALEREGIQAFMNGEYTANFRTQAPSWPKVEVRESDLEKAREVLGTLRTAPIEYSNDENEPAQDSLFRKICLLMLTIGIVLYVASAILMWLTQ